MQTPLTSDAETPRLGRLLAFLERDPHNPRLLGDAAHAAFSEGELDQAASLLDRLSDSGGMTPQTTNLRGLVALAQGRHTDAIAILEQLADTDQADGALRFNLAWANVMAGRYQAALDWLDEAAIAASPRGLRLKVQMLHHLELYSDALELGAGLSPAQTQDSALMGALATLALDAEDEAAARGYASLAGNDGEGLAALGVLALGDDDPAGAAHLFDEALARKPDNARAWIGKGLALLSEGDTREAADAIDRGAVLFDDHIGSWIAAGWAHFVGGDLAGARASFERALRIDPNFGETQGALAVLDVVEGRTEAGRKRAEVALRLDRGAFGGQPAQLLLLEQSGDTRTAERIRVKALATPIGAGGRTIGQALSAFALRRR